MSYVRISSYKLMMLLVFFDLPTESQMDRKKANRFRKNLIKLGYRRLQLSVYIKPCYSYEDMQTDIKKVEQVLEDNGDVCILMITDKQYNNMKYYYNKKEGTKKVEIHTEQLQLF